MLVEGLAGIPGEDEGVVRVGTSPAGQPGTRIPLTSVFPFSAQFRRDIPTCMVDSARYAARWWPAVQCSPRSRVDGPFG